MMRHVTRFPLPGVTLLLVAVLLASGCPGKPKPATTPASPLDALVQVLEASHEGDEARLLAALEATEEQKEFILVLSRFVVAATEFRGAFVEAYGEQAWQDFQDDGKAPKDGNAKLNMTDQKEEVAKARQAVIDERGDEAFSRADEGSKPVRFIRVKGGWRVDAGSMCPEEGEMREATDRMRPVPDVIRKYKKAIGRPGIKPEDIDAELGREVIKLLKGVETPAPHRFDVNKL